MEPVKKYDMEEITIRINNLKRRFGSCGIDRTISLYSHYSDNRCDVLNLAYRALKDRLTKIKRSKYGFVRSIEYEVRRRKNNSYDIYCNYNNFDSSSTWTITTNSIGTYTNGGYYGFF